MLGYSDHVPAYPHMLPSALAAIGYRTTAIGKNHFGWNSSTDTGVSHGYDILRVYDGLGNGYVNGSVYDDYSRWFQEQLPGQDPLKSGGLSWNDWQGAAYEYEEWLHPTAWTGRLAVEAVKNLTAVDKPFFPEGLVPPASQPIRSAVAFVKSRSLG
jgi:arylsulfatase A-like enzyme